MLFRIASQNSASRTMATLNRILKSVAAMEEAIRIISIKNEKESVYEIIKIVCDVIGCRLLIYYIYS